MFDVSAPENNHDLSLNNIVKIRPPLQSNIWDVLARNRICQVVLRGDVKQAYMHPNTRQGCTSIPLDNSKRFRVSSNTMV